MNFGVSRIVEVSMNIMTFWISVGVDNWTAERAIIASNEMNYQVETFNKLY